RKGPSTEAKQKHFVIRFEVPHQKDICVANISLKASPECLTKRCTHAPPEWCQGSRRFHRSEPRMVVRDLSRILNQRTEQLDDVRSIVREFIRGAVTAQHDVLRHCSV